MTIGVFLTSRHYYPWHQFITQPASFAEIEMSLAETGAPATSSNSGPQQERSEHGHLGAPLQTVPSSAQDHGSSLYEKAVSEIPFVGGFALLWRGLRLHKVRPLYFVIACAAGLLTFNCIATERTCARDIRGQQYDSKDVFFPVNPFRKRAVWYIECHSGLTEFRKGDEITVARYYFFDNEIATSVKRY